jgi:hypothetical protein
MDQLQVLSGQTTPSEELTRRPPMPNMNFGLDEILMVFRGPKQAGAKG